MSLDDEPIILYIKGVTKANFFDIDDLLNNDALSNMSIGHLDDMSDLDNMDETLSNYSSKSQRKSKSSKKKKKKKKYDTIPNTYKGLHEWLTCTNILCKHCCLKHYYVPIPLPEYFRQSKDGEPNVIIKQMLFCSFPCLIAYIQNHYTGDQKEQYMNSMHYMYKQFYGKELIEYIIPAPDPEEIQCFGGRNAMYTVESFKEHIMSICPMDYII